MKPFGATTLLLLVLMNVPSGTPQSPSSPAAPGNTEKITQPSQDKEATQIHQSTMTTPTVSQIPSEKHKKEITETSQSTNPTSTATDVPGSITVLHHPNTTVSPSINATEQGSVEHYSLQTVSINTTSAPNQNVTLPPEHSSSPPPPISGTEQEDVTKAEPPIKPIDYSTSTQKQEGAFLTSSPNLSAFEKSKYIAPAVMVPILLVLALSFIVWKLSQSKTPGVGQNATPKYAASTGSVQLLSVRTTTPPADAK